MAGVRPHGGLLVDARLLASDPPGHAGCETKGDPPIRWPCQEGDLEGHIPVIPGERLAAALSGLLEFIL